MQDRQLPPVVISQPRFLTRTAWQHARQQAHDEWRIPAGIALILGVWRLGILALSWLWAEIGVASPWPAQFAAMRLWRFSVRWDSEAYLTIAQHGYSQTASEPSTVAYFPWFPLAIAATDVLTPGSNVLAALVVVHLALVAALLYIFLLVRLDVSENAAWWTIGLLLMFPGAFFFSAVYPQSLLLLGIGGSLYHARRNQWTGAAAFGVVAGATSLAGMLIVIPLAIEAWRQDAFLLLDHRRIVAVAATPLGGLAFFGYLWVRFGSPGVYFDSRPDYSAGALHEMFTMTDIVLIGGSLIAGGVLWTRVRPSYGALVIATIAVLLLLDGPPGITRHVAVLFPIALLLAKFASEGVRVALAIVFTIGLALTSFLFVQGFGAG